MPRRLRPRAAALARHLAAAALVASACAAAPSTAAAACTVSASGVSFGTYDVFDPAHDDSNGTITYRCGNADHDIMITLSRGGSGTYSPRRMDRAGGGDRLDYNLYSDATRTTVWGDGTTGSGYYFRRNPPNNQDVALTVYGRIPGGQDVAVGAYTDTIIVTVNY